MRRSTAAALVAILLVAVLTRLLPLTRFIYWGSDIGEYHSLTEQLVGTGHLGTEYYGWGATYPYFPGFYFVVGGGSMMGVDSNVALNLIPTMLNAVAVLLVFLVAVRLFRDDRIGLMAAGVLAVAFPYIYANSHPIPSAIGTVLFLASMALLIGAHNEMMRLTALLPLAAAIVVTHHLSTYFLIIAILMTIVLRSLLASNFRWRSVAVEVVFLVALLALAIPFWLVYATPFRENILGDLGAVPWWGPFAALGVAALVWLAVVRLRRKSDWKFSPRFPTLRRGAAVFILAIVFVFALVSLFTIIDVLGTTIKIPPQDILYLSPFLGLVALAAPGRRPMDFARDGYRPTAWLTAFTLSLFAGAFIGEQVLIPYRHVDFMMIPVAIMIGSGIVLLHDLAFAGKRGGAAVALIAAILIAGNMAVAYPPQEIMAGYNEGTNSRSLTAMNWLPEHVDGLLATDHKASMLAFGYGYTNATWDTARETIFAENFSNAKSEMLVVNSPSGPKRVDYILLSTDVRTGAQMFPWEPAVGLSDQAQTKFDGIPYQRFYDDGYTQVYWVNWGYS
jgi:hypothetical protein